MVDINICDLLTGLGWTLVMTNIDLMVYLPVQGG